MANLYALRATDAAALRRHPDPKGPENDAWLLRLAREYSEVICARGANELMMAAPSGAVSLPDTDTDELPHRTAARDGNASSRYRGGFGA